MIFQSPNIWWCLVIFKEILLNIWQQKRLHLTPENCCPNNIKYLHLMSSVKNFLIILNHQCILNEIYGSKYSGRFKGLPVFFFKKDNKRIFENNLTSLWSGIPGKILPSRLIVLIYFRMQHQSYNVWTEGINILISVSFYQIWCLTTFVKLAYVLLICQDIM